MGWQEDFQEDWQPEDDLEPDADCEKHFPDLMPAYHQLEAHVQSWEGKVGESLQRKTKALLQQTVRYMRAKKLDHFKGSFGPHHLSGVDYLDDKGQRPLKKRLLPDEPRDDVRQAHEQHSAEVAIGAGLWSLIKHDADHGLKRSKTPEEARAWKNFLEVLREFMIELTNVGITLNQTKKWDAPSLLPILSSDEGDKTRITNPRNPLNVVDQLLSTEFVFKKEGHSL